MKDDDELESVKETLKNVEFNNEEEDNMIIDEENSEEIPVKKKDKDNSKLIIIICCVIVVILLAIIIMFATGVFNSKDNKDKDTGSTEEPDSSNVTPIDNNDVEERLEIATLKS